MNQMQKGNTIPSAFVKSVKYDKVSQKSYFVKWQTRIKWSHCTYFHSHFLDVKWSLHLLSSGTLLTLNNCSKLFHLGRCPSQLEGHKSQSTMADTPHKHHWPLAVALHVFISSRNERRGPCALPDCRHNWTLDWQAAAQCLRVGAFELFWCFLFKSAQGIKVKKKKTV